MFDAALPRISDQNHRLQMGRNYLKHASSREVKVSGLDTEPIFGCAVGPLGWETTISPTGPSKMFIYFVLGYASVDKIVNRFGKMSVKKNVRRVTSTRLGTPRS